MSTPLPFATTPEKSVFIMMRFRDGERFSQLEGIVREAVASKGLVAHIAKDDTRDPLLWLNVCRFMDHCAFGIAIFDGLPLAPDEPRLNPNICIELGYMIAKEKPCLILRDKTVRMPSDFAGHFAPDFDSENLESTLRARICTWLDQNRRILPMLQAFAHVIPSSKIALRINHRAAEKLAIGHFLVQHCFGIASPNTVLLDSGTTTAAVAEALVLSDQRWEDLTILTNNLLASLLLSSDPRFKCHVFPGQVDELFSGVFGDAATQAARSASPDVAVLACTGFTLEKGPLANSTANLEFKRAVMESCRNIILVVPGDRLGVANGNSCFQKIRDWRRVLKQNVQLIVASPPDDDAIENRYRKTLGSKLEIVRA